MNNKIIKSTLLTIASLSGVSLLVGNAFASYIVSPAPTIGVRIGISGIPKQTITYHLPTGENASTYETNTIEVNEGANLYEALSELVADNIGDYSFTSWHLANDSDSLRKDGANYTKNLLTNSYEVNDEIEVYARYTQKNIGYYNDGNPHYLNASNNSLGIDANNFCYGEKIYSVDGINDNAINLGRSSGLYNITKNSNDWTAKRVINLDVGNVSSWWYTNNNNNVKTYIYFFNDKTNGWTTELSFTNNKATFELDLAYSSFIVVRSSNSANWTDKLSQSVNISLDDKGNRDNENIIYSSIHNTCYVVDGGYGNDHLYNWW